jgi:uncharacterized PurR-regulated membrane protein YhhQ (DUF165 family)
MLTIAILVYATAMTLANLSVAHFGPWVSPLNSFVLIGVTLSLRDWLHFHLTRLQMGLLILFTGCLTYFLNPSADMIAIASSCAFTAAAMTDWLVFSKLRGTWFFRTNSSNIPASAVDSLLFPTIAFGVFMPHIVLLQFIAKVFGGALWAFALLKLTKIERVVNRESC